MKRTLLLFSVMLGAANQVAAQGIMPPAASPALAPNAAPTPTGAPSPTAALPAPMSPTMTPLEAAGKNAEAKDAQTVKTLLTNPEKDAFNFTPSFGKYTESLLFSPTAADGLMHMLSLYESGALKGKDAQQTTGGINDIMKDLNKTEVVKPKPVVYPHFRLRSIIYRSPAEWVVLLNNTRISAASNEPDRELVVLNVSRDTASFKWAPKDEVLKTAIHKDRAESPIAIESTKAAKSNTSAADAHVTYNKGARATYFSLATNQEFDAKTFEIKEGTGAIAAKPATKAPAAVGIPMGAVGGVAPAGNPMAPIGVGGMGQAEQPGGDPVPTNTQPNAAQLPPGTSMDHQMQSFGQEKFSPKAKLMQTLGLQP